MQKTIWRGAIKMNWDGLISMAILIILGLFLWSKIKKQEVIETIQEIKEHLENG